MDEEKERPHASELLEKVVEEYKDLDTITFREIKFALHERGFGLLNVIFSIPLAVPIPYPPGLTTIFGLPLLFFSVQMILGFDSPWLPKSVGDRTIKKETLARVVTGANPYLKRIEVILKPRLVFMSYRFGERVIGVVSFLCAISIALPIIFGNFVPALGILVMSLGLLRRDGLVIIIGIIISIIGLFVAMAVVLFGVAAVTAIFDKLIFW